MSFKIGQFEIIRASESITPGDRIPIILGTGRAFGSGEHETTWSCLEEMEKIPVFPGAKVLDVGSGTGILSMAAGRMGATRVIAFDPDPQSVEATMNNISLNHLEQVITVLEGELDIVADTGFDVILANLYGDILVKVFKDLSARLKPGGYMLLSGILFEYAFELKTALTVGGYDLLKVRYLEEYVTLLGKKRDTFS